MTVDVGLGLHLREEADHAGQRPEATVAIYLCWPRSVQSRAGLFVEAMNSPEEVRFPSFLR